MEYARHDAIGGGLRMVDAARTGSGLAKIAIAVALSGPVGGAQELGNQVVDRFWRDRVADRGSVRVALRDVGAALERLAEAERLPAGVVERAVGHARDVLAEFGLTAAELVSVDLDGARASALVLRRAEAVLAELGEPDSTLVRRVVREVYTVVAATAVELPDLVREYRGEVLSRLGSLASLPEETQRVVVRSAAHALVADPTRSWRSDRFPTSALLRAEYAVVPFWGRADLLDDLTSWALAGPAVAARLYAAGGGMGKTRLLLELCRRLRTDGWRAGFLRQDGRGPTAEMVAHLGRDATGVLIVVDYAETRRAVVADTVSSALSAGVRVRLVLLARAVADWWYQLRRLPDSVGDFLSGPSVGVHPLAPVATTVADRAAAFESAAVAFADLLDRPVPPAPRGLSDESYDRVLFLHMRALAETEGAAVGGTADLLDLALDREQRFWDLGLAEMGAHTLTGRPVRQAAAVVTLAGSADSFDDAVRLLRRAPLLADQPTAVVGQVAEVLRRAYPADTWLSGVQPDLLGEHLMERALVEEPTLPAAVVAP